MNDDVSVGNALHAAEKLLELRDQHEAEQRQHWTRQQLAELLQGREIDHELAPTEERLAKHNRLLVIFGASDDLCELRGAIHDEVDAYQGAMILIDRQGRLLPEIDDDDIEVLEKYGVLVGLQTLHADAIRINARWCHTPDYSWTYDTNVPHSTFDIVERGEKFCQGIVIDLKEAG